MALTWEPPPAWRRIATLDLHTGGEPLRVITGGLPPIPGRTVLEKRRYFRDHLDGIRRALMWEPRGHADMYGAVITASDDADLDVFFLHNEGYSTMCGHAILALAKLAVEGALVRVTRPVTRMSFAVPAGRIEAEARVDDDGVVRFASFRNVPSFVLCRDLAVEVPGTGRVICDIAYGGAFYALVDAGMLGLSLDGASVDRLIEVGRRIKQAVIRTVPIAHPFEPDLSFLYGTIFTGPARTPGHHSRNVCIFADGEVDRSATGSGVSARAALHHARGELPVGMPITIESIVGSTMSVTVAGETGFGPYPAVIPEVSGRAFITGRHEFLLDPDDQLGQGFLVR